LVNIKISLQEHRLGEINLSGSGLDVVTCPCEYEEERLG